MSKVAIVGSRNFTNYEFLKNTIIEWKEENNIDIGTIVSGGAKGADTLSEQFAKEHGYKILIFKPDWNTYGKAAGPIRNTTKTSVGTYDSIRKAKQKGIPVFIYNV